MMLYPSINELKTKTDSRYSLVILTAKRARDIIDEKPVLTSVQAERPVSLAANEIAEDLITYYRKEEEAEEAAAEFAVEEAARFSVEEEATEEVENTSEEEPAEAEAAEEEAPTADEE